MCVLFLWISSIVYAEGQYENKIVEKIDIVLSNISADANCETESIRSRLRTKQGGVFLQADFDSDLKKLVQDFDQIDPKIEVIDEKIYITLKIFPKPTIRMITWTGNHKMKIEELEKELGIRPGILFDRVEFTKAFHKLKAHYVKKGFFEAELDYKTCVDPISNHVDIEVLISEGRAGRVRQMFFQNFTCEEEEEILEMMITKKWSIFTSWLTNEGAYNEDAVQQDRLTIVNYLVNKGYADARVDFEVREAASAHRIILTITADKGEIYRFGPISIKGNAIFTEQEILRQFTFSEGDVYSPDALRNTISNITHIYGKKGYIDAFVDYETKLDPENRIFSIDLTMEEGEQFKVGLIKVLGNCTTQSSVILHETFLIPGEIFNIDKLQKTEERLRNTELFKSVNVYATRSQEVCGLGPNYRDVIIEVEETSTGNFGALAGYSTVESVFGGIKISEKNFNYKGLGNIFRDGYRAVRGGGEYVNLSGTIGAKSRTYMLSWTKPYFMDTQWTVGFDLERSNNRYISSDYDINASRFSLHAGYQINQFLRFGWHYRLSDSHVTVDAERKASGSKISHEGSHHESRSYSSERESRSKERSYNSKGRSYSSDDESVTLTEQAKDPGLISATGISLTYDSTNSISDPRNGFRSQGLLEFAGLGGNATFFSAGYLNSYYIPFGKEGVIKFRGDAKFIYPCWGTNYEKIPIDERLFLGGDTAVRGYRPYAIGPKFKTVEGKLTNDPAGGISMYLISAEYKRNLSQRFDLFVFFDGGHLSKHKFNTKALKTAVGFGLYVRVLESGPPLVIGMGYPLNAHRHSDVKKFFFSVGTQF
jgi:outer membrane protein insertion porin family